MSSQGLTREHVIGRRFVPKGTLENQWNLIANACRKCNGIKSGLEDDISAVTMSPDVFGEFAVADDRLVDTWNTKANGSLSRLTRLPIRASEAKEIVTLGDAARGVKLTATLVGPPQAELKRLFHLAEFQIRAFFFLLTFNREKGAGLSRVGEFTPAIAVPKCDWGNRRAAAFASTVSDWECRLLAITANHFFKVEIRKQDGVSCWSWALEWNCRYRLLGFLGTEGATAAQLNTLPPIGDFSDDGNRKGFVVTRDTALQDQEDLLFRHLRGS